MDEQPKKASLRGRGKEIMQGASGKNEPEDKPQFEDDDALLNWITAGPEEETLVAGMPIPDALQTKPETLFPDPDFDLIFGETVPSAPAAPRILPDEPTLILTPDQKPSSLDDIFTEADPSFDDLFGDVSPQAAVAQEQNPFDELLDFELPTEASDVRSFDVDTFDEELPELEFPEEDDLEKTWVATPPEPVHAEPDLEKTFVVTPRSIEPPPVETADEALIVEGLDDVPAPRADRRSASLPTVEKANDSIIVDGLDDVPAPRADRRSIAPAPIPEPEIAPAEADWLADDLALAAEPIDEEAMPMSEKEDIKVVDLRGQKLERGALAGLIPQQPEELPPGQFPFGAYEETPAEQPPVVRISYEPDPEPEPVDDSFLLEGEDIPLPSPVMASDPPEIGGATEETDYDLAEEIPVETGRRSAASLEESTLIEPFRQPEARKSAAELFKVTTAAPDATLLGMLVDDSRVRELFSQIESMQEDIVTHVRGERGNTDAYHEELQLALNLLLQSRENYDESRAILYRVRADLNRERRVAKDIENYRPLLTNIHAGMFIVWLALLPFGVLVIDRLENLGVEWIGQGYYPTLLGFLGALIFTWRKLYHHISVDRDFDPVHLNWYIVNPIVGGVMGFLMYLLFTATFLTSVIPATDVSELVGPAVPANLILAFIAGYNQNTVMNALGSVRDRFAPDRNSSQEKP